MLGLACDLDAGSLLVAADGGPWETCAFPAGPRPGGVVGGGLHPFLTGADGLRVRCNWGADAARPLKHAAPSGEYRAVGLAGQVRPTVAPALRIDGVHWAR